MKDLMNKYEKANAHLTKWMKVRSVGVFPTVMFMLGF